MRRFVAVFTAATASRSPEGLPIELPGYEPEFAPFTTPEGDAIALIVAETVFIAVFILIGIHYLG